jgi:hypothetical protein
MSQVWKNLGNELTIKKREQITVLTLQDQYNFNNNLIPHSSNLGLALPYILEGIPISFIPTTQEIIMVIATIRKLLDKIDIYGITYSLYVNYLTKRELEILAAKGYYIYRDYKDYDGYYTHDLRTFVEVPSCINIAFRR